MSETQPLKILVAEDNEANLYFLKTILRREGYEVSGTINGTSALDYFTKIDFDLVLLDLNLPGLSGCELLKVIRHREKENNRFYKVFAITGSSKKEVHECTSVEFDEWLYKPFSKEDLFSIIRKYF